MSKVYVVKMWLSSGAESKTELDQFDRRFTRTLQREWDVMVFDESVDLAKELEHALFNGCNSAALVDVQMGNDLTKPVKTRAFSTSSWIVSGGRHEVGRNVMVQLEDGSTVPWVFKGDSSDLPIQVHASWKVVPVQSRPL